MHIYSVPPILSFLVLFVLFLIGIFKANKTKRNLLFSFISLLGALLNLDKFLLTIVKDENLALRISRIDHLFLVFVIPFYLHFTLSLTGHRGWYKLLKLFYVCALLLLPLTQSNYYLKGVSRHYFGLFADAGPIFNIFVGLSFLSIALSFLLLLSKLKRERVLIERLRIKYIILSFGVSAIINHFDILVMKGYELYPLGNFIFIPMSLIAYAIYKFDIMDWKLFLHRGVNFTVLILFSAGVFTGSGALMKVLFKTLNIEFIHFIAFFVSIFFFYFFFSKIENLISAFLEQGHIRRIKAIKDLSYDILHLYDMEEISKKVEDRLKNLLPTNKCKIKMVSEAENATRFLRPDEEIFSEGYRIVIPIDSKYLPSHLVLGEKSDKSLYTGEEVSILSVLANHIALSFDNAFNYKDLKEMKLNLEKLVEERTKALIRSESLALVGRLAAGVAHELNNPIASVMSTLEYYLEHLEKKDPLSEDLEFSLKELKRARDIIKSLLDASRQKEETKEHVDIHVAIEDALRILYNQYKSRKIEIRKHFMAEESVILGVTSRLCQVFLNIIKNSLDAINVEPGLLVIETRNRKEEIVEVRVIDNGEGIEEAHIKDIFKPFFTTKSQGKGVGLGLFIVHEIVMDCGGSIEVKSEKGKGTEFILSFPSYRG